MNVGIQTRITRTGTGWTKREWQEIMRRAWLKAGQYWHKKVLPRKFTREGAEEFDYAPRTPKYMRWKAVKLGHQIPLVKSGQLQRDALRTEDVKERHDGVTVKLNVPAYTYKYKNENDPRKDRELDADSPRSTAEIMAVLDREIERQGNKPGTTPIDLRASMVA